MNPALRVTVFKSDEDGQWYFHVKARNGRIIAASEGYRRRLDAIKTVDRLKDEMDMASVEVDPA